LIILDVILEVVKKVTLWSTGPKQQKIDYPEPERHFHHTFCKNASKTAQKLLKKQQKNIKKSSFLEQFLMHSW
jgi:hypothetical protein